MNIVTFDDINENYTQGHKACYYHSGCDNKTADVAILDINSIFEYEEHKLTVCKENFSSVAIIDDASDFDAFKNFGITAWIKREDLAQMPNLLSEIQSRMGI
jgi:hypothetical protein